MVRAPAIEAALGAVALLGSGCTLLFDPGPTRELRRLDAALARDAADDGGAADDARTEPPDSGLDPCAARCTPGQTSYCEPRTDRTRHALAVEGLQRLLGVSGPAGLAVTGPADEAELALILEPGETLRDHAVVDLGDRFDAVAVSARRGALRLGLTGRAASELAPLGPAVAIDTSLSSISWISARGPYALFGDDGAGGDATARCVGLAGCVRTDRTGPTVGALAGSTAFVALGRASSWSFLDPGLGDLPAGSDQVLRGTASETVVVAQAGPPRASRLVLGAPGARVSAVDLGPCARAAAREDGGVVIVRADTCERVPTLLRAEETSCTGTACACGEACTGGADEALLDVRPLGLPSDRLLDWELEAQGSVRVVAMLVGDTSASSPGTDVLVAAWNAAEGAGAPRRVEPVLVSSGRLPTVRGLGRSLELVTRRTAGALDVVVGVEVEAGGVDVLAVGGVTFCAR
jgi:hypothetical protein